MNQQPTSRRIIHVALFTRNPQDLAPFYRDAFGMKIVHVGGAVQLWDGHILLALNPWRGVGEEKLRIDEVGEPQAKGFDHFGFKIENLEETKGLLKEAGSDAEVMKRPVGRTFTEWRAHDLEGNRITGMGGGARHQQRGEKADFFHENLLKRPLVNSPDPRSGRRPAL